MRFGSWSPAANAAPQNAPGPPAFNDRFGKWGSAPADDFDDSSSPVLHYLEKYRNSALPATPGSLPSPQMASLPAVPSGSIAPGSGNAGLDDISGLPSWMRNALAYQPEKDSTNAASPDDNVSAASDDRKNIRRLSSFLR